jgi:8-oxo-dGTP pyrophosphatase MutT (NUDIX family)
MPDSLGPMEVNGPVPGEELHAGPTPVTPRQAATVIVLRGGSTALEVLLVQRNPEARFMGGAWVFPGGAVDADETDSGDVAHRLAGVREVEEESGVRLPGPEALHPFSRWITPRQLAIRFDTHFFLARVPDGAQPRVDGAECVDWGWWAPQAALDAHADGQLMMAFPTIKTLEALTGFTTADELLAWADGRKVVPIEPRVIVEGEVARVVLPGEPGYEA